LFRRSFHFLKALLFLLGIFASANLSASNGEFDGESRITRERSGLFAGDGGFDIKVGDATSLTGSVIHSEATPDQNRLVTGSLDVASLEDISKWNLETGSVSLSGSYNTKTGGSGNGPNGVGMGLPSSDGGDETRTVASGISAGELIVEDGMLPEIRRDTQALLDEEILDSLPDDLQQQLAEAQEIAAAAKDSSASLAKAVGDISTMLEDPARKQETERIIGSYKRGELSAEEAGSQINAALQDGNGWSENGLNRIITHALTQGLIAGFAGGDVGSGLQGVGGVIAGNLGSRLATSLNETFGLTGSTADFSQNFFSTAMGALAGGGTGGFVAGSVDENNRQLHGSELTWIFENAKKFSELTGLSLNEALNLLLIAGHAGVDGLEEALVGRESESYREKIAQAQAFLATNPSGLFKATDAEKFDDPLEKWMPSKFSTPKATWSPGSWWRTISSIWEI